MQTEVEDGGSTGGGSAEECQHGLEADLLGRLTLTTKIPKIISECGRRIDVCRIDAHQREDLPDSFFCGGLGDGADFGVCHDVHEFGGFRL